MGCDPDPPSDHIEHIDHIAEAHRIRKRVLEAVPEVVPSMLTLVQLEVWLEVFQSDGSIRRPQFRSYPDKRQLKVLRAIERRFYP